MARQQEPGWYSDPDAPGHWRWWDGERWTEHAASAYPTRTGAAPTAADPSAADPSAADPSAVDPSPVDPSAADPRSADAGPTYRSAAASSAADAEASYPPAGSPAAHAAPTYLAPDLSAADAEASYPPADLSAADVVASYPPAGSPAAYLGAADFGAADPGAAEPGALDWAAGHGAGASGTASYGATAGYGVAGAGDAGLGGGTTAELGAATAPQPTAVLPGPAATAPRPGRAHPRSRAQHAPGVFVKRWAALLAVVAVVVIVLVIALQGHPPALYWQGEPLSNGGQVLSRAETSLQAVAASDEGSLSSQSRCYFSLPTRSAHDVAAYLRCGPVLLPWSSPKQAWLTYPLTGRLTKSGEKLSVAVSPPPTGTVALARGEVLRRPDGTVPPVGAAGLSLPAVPRQPPGWGGALDAPPLGLPAAPVSDLIGDWGRSYRLVAYGEVGRLSSRLDRSALRDALNPRGSAWATSVGSKASGRPLAPLLLPPQGQQFVVAELALSPGESAGAVPAGAAAAGSASSDQPTVTVTGGAPATSFAIPTSAQPSAGSLTVAAVVPMGSKPVLEITDKGLTQTVSLVNGQLGPGPSILSRAGTNEPLDVTGSLDGATVQVNDASLVWFAGSDGGTVPPSANDAYLEILATATPPQASFLPASDFTLELPGGAVVHAQALPDADRQAIVVGFVVPASFSDGTVVVSAGGRSFDVPVHFT